MSFTRPAPPARRQPLDEFERRFGQLGARERRQFPFTVSEIRDSGAGGGQFTVTGHAAVFNQWSLDLGFFRERIAPGAFDDVLAGGPDVWHLWDHDTRYVFSRTSNGTLELATDQQGLRFWSRVAPTSYAEDLRVLLERGDIDQSSFAFIVAEDEWVIRTDQQGAEVIERTVIRIGELFDVTTCAMGAYPQTDSQVARTVIGEYAAGRAARGAIAYKKTPLAAADAAWDGGAEVADASVDDLKAMCAWVDAENPDVKDSYKLPHHRAAGEHACVWAGVKAAMTRLLQQGTQIPDGDRQAVYNHLAKHYQDFEQEPPEFHTVAPADDPAGGTGPRQPAGPGNETPSLVALRAKGRRARLLHLNT